MSRVYDDERLARGYERGNEMPEAALRAWVELIAPYVPQPAVSAGGGRGFARRFRGLRPGLVVPCDPPHPRPRTGDPRTGPCGARRRAGRRAHHVPRTAGRGGLRLLAATSSHRRAAFSERREVVADFVSAGFVLEDITSFAPSVTASLAEYHSRLAGRPQSKFTRLTDEEFRQGLADMEDAARDEALDGPRPVLERYDVAVFSRS